MTIVNLFTGRNTMLKKYFKQFTDFKAKRNIAIFLPLAFILFICAGYAFFENLRTICNILGAIVCKSSWQAIDHLKRCGSTIILLFGVLYLLTYLYRLFFYCEEKRNKIQKKGAIALISIGGVVLLYFVIGLCTRLYHIYEGYPTILFPIDAILLSLIFIGLGIFFLLDKKVVQQFSMPGLIPDVKRNYAVKILKVLAFVLSYFVACFSMYGLIMGPFIFDWRPYPIWGILFLMMLLAYLFFFGFKSFVVPFLKDELRKQICFKTAILMIAIGVVLVVLNTIAVFNYDNVACAVANGLLVISFTASFNAEYYIYAIALLASSLIMFIRNFPKK